MILDCMDNIFSSNNIVVLTLLIKPFKAKADILSGTFNKIFCIYLLFNYSWGGRSAVTTLYEVLQCFRRKLLRCVVNKVHCALFSGNT